MNGVERQNEMRQKALARVTRQRNSRTAREIAAEQAERALIKEARDRGASWQEIGDALGMTRQNAWREYR